MTVNRSNNRWPLLWPAAVVLVGWLAAAGAALWQYRANEALASEQLQALAQRAQERVSRRMRLYEYGLRGARSAVIVAGNDVETLSREHFRRFAKSQDALNQYPGIVAFAFVRRVPPSEENTFLASMRQEGFADLHIRLDQPHPGDRFIVQYIEPFDANAQALGHDIASESRRRKAIEQAIRSAQPSLTAPVTLVQTPDDPEQFVLLYLAAYRSVGAPPPAQRDAQAFGIVTASLAMGKVMQGLDDEDDAYAVALADVTQPGAPQVLYTAPTWLAGAHVRVQSLPLDLYGRHWRMQVQALPAFEQRLNLRSPAAVAAAIAASTVLMALLLGARLRAAQRERTIQLQRAQMAAVVHTAHDAIVLHTPQDFILAWNPGAEQLLGWTAAEVVGRNLIELAVPQALHEQAQAALARVQRGEDVPPFDTVRLDKHGAAVPVLLSISPVFANGPGLVSGAATTMRDMRVQHAARERVEQANASLQQALERLRDSEAQARHSADLLEQLIEGAPDPIWTKDADGRWVVVNSATAAVLGRSREELVGRRDRDVLPASFADKVEAEDQRILGQAAVVQVEETLFDASRGEERVFSSVKVPLRGADGQIVGLIGIARDVTERRTAEARLAEINATLEQLVQQRTAELTHLAAREQAIVCSAASAIIATDLAGRITVFNPAAEAMLRIPAQQALGRLEVDFRDHEEMRARLHLYPCEVLENSHRLPDWLAQAARQALAGPRVHDGGQRSEWTYVRADGTRVPGLVSISLLRGEHRQPTGFLAVITDLTERKALEEQLRERTRQAEAASRAKSAFLANMSHEIRTPLNAVIGLSQLLRRRALPTDVEKFVGHIHDAGEQLLALVSDVLDLSRIEAGEMALEAIAFDPVSLLNATLALVRPQAEHKGLELAEELDARLPPLLVGDPLRLRQVLLNLLSNAVKFTATGRIALRARVVAQDAQRLRLRLGVADTGIGIAPEAQVRIFDTFTQADDSTTRRFGGSGLGLSIVRRLVAMMGGELDLRSTPGAGSTFSVTVTFELPGRAGQQH